MRILSINLVVWMMTVACLRGATITDLNPPYAAVGERIEIQGTGFAAGTVTIKFWNGVTANTQGVSDSSWYAWVPSGAVSGPVSVQINGGTASYSPYNFTVIGNGPYIHSFSPVSGAGKVTITGAHINFANVQVKFNGTNGTINNYVNPPVVEATPSANYSTGPITITTSGGSFTTTSNYFAQPGVTGLNPFRGRAGTNVLITGRNLLGTTNITFGGVKATAFNVLSNGALTVSVPTNAPTGYVQVFAPGGNFPVSSNFLIEPVMTGFSPTSGPVGTPVTITGANFNEGGTNVWFNATKATTVTNISFGQLTAVVPSGATTGPIGVQTANGGFTNTALFYLPASIMGFSPTNSAPGSSVVISGQNLLGASAVSFNLTPAAFTPPTNNTTLVATVPAGFTTGPIYITTPAWPTNSGSLLFYAPPVITGFAPASGLPGTNVVLTGQNFLGAKAVRFGEVTATFVPPTNNTTLVVTVPVGAQTGPITVVAPAGTNTSLQDFVLEYRSDLRLTGGATPEPVTVTSNLLYTIQVLNSGPHPAPNVKLTNTLPASVVLKSAVLPGGTLATNGNVLVGTLATLNSGASVTMSLVVAPTVAGSITNLSVVGSDYVDPAPGNNTLALASTVYPLPLLSITKLSATRLRLAWPVVWSNYVLQSSGTLVDTNGWSNILTAPGISGPDRFVLETNNQPFRFYRLKQ